MGAVAVFWDFSGSGAPCAAIKLGEELSPYGINERYGVRDIGDEKARYPGYHSRDESLCR